MHLAASRNGDEAYFDLVLTIPSFSAAHHCHLAVMPRILARRYDRNSMWVLFFSHVELQYFASGCPLLRLLRPTRPGPIITSSNASRCKTCSLDLGGSDHQATICGYIGLGASEKSDIARESRTGQRDGNDAVSALAVCLRTRTLGMQHSPPNSEPQSASRLAREIGRVGAGIGL